MARLADLLSVEEARARILDGFHRLPAEEVPLEQALGRFLSHDIAAPINVPPFANSSMDGFAVRGADTALAGPDAPVRLPVRSYVPAGSMEQVVVEPGECARIMTGAPLPEGADAVVPFEDVEEREGSIIVSAPVQGGACVRPAGNDMRSGQPVLQSGSEIHAQQLALLASLGYGTVPVVRRPLVAVLSTGDELVSPGQPLRPGQIYNSNTPMLAAAVGEAGALAATLPHVADEPGALRAAMASARDADVLITSGGASVGDFDYVKDVVGEAGELQFWRVRVRPGKPLLLGRIGPTPVIGLPGNPTSAMVTFEQFVRPALRVMLGAPPLRPQVRAIVDERIDNRGGRRTFARVSLEQRDGRFHVRPSGPQDSAMLLPLATADGLLEISEDTTELLPGDEATVQVWRLPG